MSAASVGISQGNAAANQRISPALPPLREELDLFAGTPTIDGAPTWVLHDPVANRYFRFGWKEYEILSRWHQSHLHAILDDIHQQTLLTINAKDVDDLLKFLAAHNLLQSRGAQSLARLKEQSDKHHRRDAMWLIKNYLFIRIPLVRPDRFLERTLPWLKWMGSPAFLLVTLFVAFTGLFLAQRNWDGFLSQFPYFFTLPGFLLMVVTLSVAKVMHELGHAYLCKAFGCRVPSMGVALLVMWPVLYTDASDAWRLTSRRQRLLIDTAGIAVELGLAIYATLLWSFLPDGPLRSAIFLLATATWIVTLFINLNPFMRFDGYYVLSDLLGIPNLQDRAFALGRWKLREFLFGFGFPPPEVFSQHTYRLLLVYAFGTWVYRFFLFLGIALLVYFLFFKLLGIFLMMVELVWFIGRPIYLELKSWVEHRQHLQWNHQTMRTLIFFGLFLLFFTVPWQQDVTAPGLWHAEQQARLYAPAASRVQDILVQPGEAVKAGKTLFVLESPDLTYELENSQQTLDMLNWQTEFQSISTELTERAPVIWQEMQAQTAKHHALSAEIAQLTVKSPIDGVVREVSSQLQRQGWVSKNEWLGNIVTPAATEFEGWIQEADLSRVTPDSSAMFYPEDLTLDPVELVITTIDEASTRELTAVELASIYDGPIAVRQDSEGRLIPERPVYRMIAHPLENMTAPNQVLRGSIHIDGKRQSLLSRLWRNVTGVLIRESGF